MANVPKNSGDGRGVGGLRSSAAFGGFSLRRLPGMQPIIEPSGVNLAGNKIRIVEDVNKKPHVGFDSDGDKFEEGAARPRQRFRAIATPYDQFRQKWIVIRRDAPTRINTFVQANAGAVRRRQSAIFPGEGKKLLSGSSA